MFSVQGLTHFKYDEIVTKSLDVLDKYFSNKLNVFKTAIRSQVLMFMFLMIFHA